jgi:hypothetical protein
VTAALQHLPGSASGLSHMVRSRQASPESQVAMVCHISVL